MKRIFVLVVAILLLASVGLGAGCAEREPGPSPEPTASPEPTSLPEPPSETADIRVYFTRGEKIGVGGREVAYVPGDDALATAAMEALLAGPTAEERQFGLGTVIPDNTTLNGVTMTGPGTMTVDLSAEFKSGGGSLSMLLRTAQVVYTLTQFEGVTNVSFRIDGTPVDALGGEGVVVGPSVTRADFEDVTPVILVESPFPGQTVTSPFTVSGTANVFEAQFTLNVTDPEGLIITEQAIMATSGTGTRGTFSTPVEFESTRSGLGAFIVFEPSPKDGAPTNVVEIPVRMTE